VDVNIAKIYSILASFIIPDLIQLPKIFEMHFFLKNPGNYVVLKTKATSALKLINQSKHQKEIFFLAWFLNLYPEPLY